MNFRDIPIVHQIERKCLVVGDHPMEVLERVYEDGLACVSCPLMELDEERKMICPVREDEHPDPYDCAEVCNRLENEDE